MVLGCLLWTGPYALDYLFIHPFWHRVFLYLVHTGVVIACLGAVLTGVGFTQKYNILTKNLWFVLFILPFSMLVLIVFDPVYHTLLKATYLTTIEGRTQWIQVLPWTTYLVEYVGTGIWSFVIILHILRESRNDKPEMRRKYFFFLLPYSIVWIVAIAHLIGLRPFPGLNATPVTLSLLSIWIFFSINYFRVYDIVQLARAEIIDALDEPVIIIDTKERVVDWNFAAERIFLLDRKFYSLDQASEFFKYTPELHLKLKHLPEKKPEHSWQWTSSTPTRNWEVKSKKIRDKDRNNIGLILSFRDVTEQRLLEAKMAEANRALQLGNATKDRFLSIISHDLRGPLIGIKSLLKILNERMDKQDKTVSEMTESLVDATESIFSLLENLLEWSKLQRGQEDFSPSNLSLLTLVEEATNLFELNAGNKDLHFVIQIPTVALVYCDNRMIYTVLRNLISNAIKFSFRGSKIEIKATEFPKEWQLDIKDEGVGMEKQTIAKLFQVGEVVKSLGTQGETGNGIGLLLCKEFIEKNNGTLFADSDGLHGSTFSIRLPKAMIEV